VCQDEDVMIDDIAVVVAELSFLQPFEELVAGDRKEVSEFSIVSIPDTGKIFAAGGDLVRGSFVPAREIARRMIDPKRGSYATGTEKIEDVSPELFEQRTSK
jgi:hypothetical protein